MPLSRRAKLGIAGATAAAIVVLLAKKTGAEPPPPPPGKGNLYGLVTDEETSGPVPEVLVSLELLTEPPLPGMPLTTLTDDNGYYEFLDRTPGDYTAQFSKAGYETVTY